MNGLRMFVAGDSQDYADTTGLNEKSSKANNVCVFNELNVDPAAEKPNSVAVSDDDPLSAERRLSPPHAIKSWSRVSPGT